jgi:hypothetical protein
MSLFGRAAAYWRLGGGLKAFLRETLTLEQSRELIRQGLRNREQSLLMIVRRAIYDNEASPYLKLLRLAGCEYADFEKMVRSDGIEASLHRLRETGVYLSYEEFKGKKEVVRSGKTFRFDESDFDNPFLLSHFEARGSASRSTGTRIVMDLDRCQYRATHSSAVFDAHGIWGQPVLVWMPILPSVLGLMWLLWTAKAGNPPLRWFSPVEAERVKPSLVKRLGTYYTVYASRLFGTAFPKPEYVSLDRADKIAGCMAEVLRKGQGCVLGSYTNPAIRVCQAARERKLDISGATFSVGGEPLTEAKLKEIRAVGAKAINSYGAAEAGLIGSGCANPVAVDDMHLLKDSQALIQHRRETLFGGASVDALLFTSLLVKAPKVLLNVELGDYGVIETRQCGCKLEELGLTEHIYNIRSFDKLTGEGMSFAGTDLVRIMEEILPARFGGTSIDYQMMEEEDKQGHTRLSIIVSPEVGEIDEDELVQTVLTELSKGKDTQRMMTEIWAQAGMLRVRRQRPFVTATGKLLPLHIQKSKIKEGT